jgi:hypothetical protein
MNSEKLLGYEFNEQQNNVLQLIANFIKNNYMNPLIIPNGERGNIGQLSYEQINHLSRYPRFLLTGSAGTGKTSIITYLILTSWFNLYPLSESPKYIIAAPTNKAKDVLMNKYNLIKQKVFELINTDPEINAVYKNYNILTKCNELVQFKTLSQILGINSQINKDGHQEFTKGNIFRMHKKYAKKDYSNTIIIIDECSMIDDDSFKLVQQIPKPVIFMGDPCQLPPVNEDFSNVFALPDYDNQLGFYMLTEVMRSKDLITNCCNYMRDIILGLNSEHPNINLDNIYNKYVVPDPKNKNIRYYIKEPKKWFSKYVVRCLKDKVSNDMGICYTNKRCSELNMRMRIALFKQIKALNPAMYEALNDPPFIMHNEKIIVKSPYYVYDNVCYNSLILRIYDYKETVYKPLSFLDWIKKSINMQELKDDKELTNADFDKILEEALNAKEKREKEVGTLFSFGFNPKNTKDDKQLTDEEIMKKQREIFTNIIRDRFYVSHNYSKKRKEWYDYKTKTTVIPDELLDNDPFIKLETIIRNIDKDTGKNITKEKTEDEEENEHAFLLRPSYNKIHSNITEFAFGIPLDKINCSVCKILAPYIMQLIKERDALAMELISITNNCNMGCYICSGCDNMNKKYRFAIINEDYLDKYNTLKKRVLSILSKCSSKKIKFTRKESTTLKSSLNDEVIEDLLNALGPYHQESGVIKSIPYSLLFGHYWNHMFVEPILDWDYGYFITTHKSQGSDYDHVFVDGNNIMRNTKLTEKDKLIYTGLSRAKSKLNIYL